VFGIAVGTVLAVTAIVITAWLVARPSGPDAVADAFLSALAAGEGDDAAALLADPPPEAVIERFADAAAYISDPDVRSIDAASEDAATAVADIALGGTTTRVTLALVRTPAGWRVQDGLGSVTASTTLGDSIRIGGVLARAGDAVPVLPAAYDVEAAPGDLLVGREEALAFPGAEVEVTVRAALGPDAETRAQEGVDAYADDCARPAQAVPERCGIRIPWAADLATLTAVDFRIEAHPVVELSEEDLSFTATDGVLVATVTGVTRAGDEGSFTYRTDTWTLRGDLSFRGDRMVLAVR
jgi:hypothetical protein